MSHVAAFWFKVIGDNKHLPLAYYSKEDAENDQNDFALWHSHSLQTLTTISMSMHHLLPVQLDGHDPGLPKAHFYVLLVYESVLMILVLSCVPLNKCHFRTHTLGGKFFRNEFKVNKCYKVG